MSSGRRLIASCLTALAAAVLMLGCGSGEDVTNADIDPQIASDLSGQLDRIQAFFEADNCDRASKAVGTLRDAIERVSGSTGEEFTANALELTDNLQKTVDEQCQPAEKPTTSSESTDTLPTTTVPTTTDTLPTTTETTTKSTTTKSTTTTTTTTTAPEPPTGPGGDGPGGGVQPGNGKRKNPGGPRNPKPHGAGGPKDDQKKERSR
ncbi:MAG: hypothetical protein R2718_10415 [Solirubrobacterales bacterium]|nr:hypothetical protein [Solirubrobacterales bacterium]